MPDEEATEAKFHPEFKSALGKLHKVFGAALWDIKLKTCFAASSEVKRAKSAKSTKKKVEIVSRQFEQWKEGSVRTIREWLPKFAQLGAAHPEAIQGELIQWTKDNVWTTVEGQCGIQRLKEGDWRHDRVNRVTVYWFAVASEGNVGVNKPPVKPWCAPRWLAADRQATDALLEEYTGDLWLRLSHVIDEELDLVEIQRAITRSSDVQPSSGVWRDVENRFRNLEREGGKEIGADWHSTAWPANGQHWNLRGTNELLRQRFEWIAQSAALKLGHADVSTGLYFWLDLLKRDSPGFNIDVHGTSNLPDGSQVHSEGGIIRRICAISADYCLKLENDEVAQSMRERLNISLGATGGDPAREHGTFLASLPRTGKAAAIEQTERTTQPELRARQNNASLYPKDESYQIVVFRGSEYNLTPRAGAIVKLLHEAGGKPITKSEIQSRIKLQFGVPCGKIFDSFRSLDAPKVWSELIEVTEGRKGFYRLRSEAFGDSQEQPGRFPKSDK